VVRNSQMGWAVPNKKTRGNRRRRLPAAKSPTCLLGGEKRLYSRGKEGKREGREKEALRLPPSTILKKENLFPIWKKREERSLPARPNEREGKKK